MYRQTDSSGTFLAVGDVKQINQHAHRLSEVSLDDTRQMAVKLRPMLTGDLLLSVCTCNNRMA